MLTDRFRYFLLVIGFLCLTSIASNYIIINFTFICMKDDMSHVVQGSNGTKSVFDYDPRDKQLIVWAVAAGTIVGTFPINYAYIKYGAKWPFFIAGAFSTSSTLLTPLAAEMGMISLLIVRFIQGLAYSADFAAIGIICVRWAPLKQTASFIAVLTTFTAMAPTVTNPVSGFLCESSFGWRWAFYSHGIFCLIVFLLWIFFYDDDPQFHKSVSTKELECIQKNKTQAHINRDSFVPYWEICKNKIIIVVWINAFVEMVGVTILVTYSPTFFHQALGYDIGTTGILVSATAFSHIPPKMIMGVVSDYMSCVSETAKMYIFNTIAVGLAGVFYIGIGFIPASLNYLSVACFAGIYLSMALNPGAFYKCASLVSRQYAHFVIATIQFMKCIALFVAPLLVTLFVSDEQDTGQWRYTYLSMALMLIVANILFYFVATDKPADFTLITRESREKEKQTDKITPEKINMDSKVMVH